MYYIKNIKKLKFAYIEDGKPLDYVDRTSFASSYDSKKSAKEDLSLIKDKHNHIVVDKDGFPV